MMNYNRIRQVACVILGICSALFLTNVICDRQELRVEAKVAETQKELAQEVLRFHVLANSDGEEDQTLKLLVRDEILAYMKQNYRGDNGTVAETEQWAAEHLEEITECAEKTIRAAGYSYAVTAEISDSYFPDKTYGDVWFPKGYYRALRVEIGEGKGQNWWCVLYPTLCFTEAMHAVVSDDGKEELKQVLTEEEYDMVTKPENFKIKSFFFEGIFGEN